MDLHPLVASHVAALGIAFEILDCDPAFADTAAFCEHYGIDPADSANTILVASRRPPGAIAACVVLATTRLDVNRRVRDEMQVKKLSFASTSRTLDATGMEIGGVTAFGLPDEMAVFIDQAVVERPKVVVGGGNRRSKLRLDPAGLLAIATARVVDIARPA